MHCKDTILRTQNNWPYSKLIPNSGNYKQQIMSMNNIEGFVFYVDILGFTALTQDKIQLTEDDYQFEKIYISII